MSKDEVWEIIFFFHTNRTKVFFPDSSSLKNDRTFFPTFLDPGGTLNTSRTFALSTRAYGAGKRDITKQSMQHKDQLQGMHLCYHTRNYYIHEDDWK